MQTNMLKNIFKTFSIRLATIALLLACMNAGANGSNVYRPMPFPSELERYKTQIFNLFDKTSVDSRTGEHQYDEAFVKQFKTALKPYLDLDPKLERKLFSGPAPEGIYVELGDAHYLFYTICQAHACKTTNLAILYQPGVNRLSGRLQYKCRLYPLNRPRPAEAAAIDSLSPIDKKDPFYQESCNYEKQGAQ